MVTSKRLTAWVLLLAAALVSCGQAPRGAAQARASATPTATPTPTPTPFLEATATPSPADGSSPSPGALPSETPPTSPATSYGVLVSLAASEYYVFLIGTDGKIAATSHAARRTKIVTGDAVSHTEATDLPYVSATRDRVYYLDGDSALRWLSPTSNGVAMSLPGGPKAYAAFAVSPDDARVAVAVIDFAPRPPVVHLSVGPLGGPLTLIYSSASDYRWPVGWRAGKLVAAQNSSPWSDGGVWFNPYHARSYAVMDPANGAGLASVGSWQSLDACPPTGLLTAAGTACYLSTSFMGQSGGYSIADWTGYRYLAPVAASWDASGSVSPSPNSVTVAVCCAANAATGSVVVSRGKDALTVPLPGQAIDWPCWIDSTHLLTGFTDLSQQSELLDLTSMRATPTGRSGFCAAVFPTDLG
jgi:hypothetical protein